MIMSYKISAFSFSNNDVSLNTRGLFMMKDHLDLHICKSMYDYKMPLLDSNDVDGHVPKEVKNFDNDLRETDVFIFSVPEHTAHYSAVFKNAMDWLVVKSNMNNNLGTTYGFSKKPVFITTFTASKKAGGRHFDMTKHLVEKMGGIVVGTKVFNDCWDNLIPSNDTFVENFCYEVNDFVKGYNGHEEIEVKQWKDQSEFTEKYNNWKKQWK